MRRWLWVIATCVAALGSTTLLFFHPLPKLIWNATPSVPIGLYIMHPADRLHVDELVVVRPLSTLAQFLDERHYLPKGTPMLKRVLALPGQIVCRNARTVTVDGVAMGDALDNDARGLPLPAWQGCQHIAQDEVFLMNWRSEVSFDGRYFGPSPMSTVMGRADPVWTVKR